MIFSRVSAVFRKEWRDARRDKRSFRIAFLMPVYFVAITIGILWLMIYLQSQSRVSLSETTSFPVSGVEHFPPLVDWLREKGFHLHEEGDGGIEKFERGEIDYLLVIPDDAMERYAAGNTISLRLYFDATKNTKNASVYRLRHEASVWSAKIGGLRLVARGVAPFIAQPLAIQDVNSASQKKMASMVLMNVPMFLMLILFIAAIGFSIDMLAGERERRSLESLLITPVSSAELVIGKGLLSFCISMLSLVLMLALFYIGFLWVPFSELGIDMEFTIQSLILCIALLAPVAMLATSLQLFLSTFAKSFKDAQSLMGLLVLVPTIPSVYLIVSNTDPHAWFYVVPVLAQVTSLRELFFGGVVSAVDVLSASSMTLLVSITFITLTVKRLRSATHIFGK